MRISAFSFLVIVVAWGASPALAHEGLPSEYNYRDDVRPIFVEHCAGCHRPGGVGPMSLLSYSDTVPWANAIKMQVLENQMPPWLPAEGVGAFRHTRSLSAAEIDILLDWLIGQTPEGEPLSPEDVETEPRPSWALGEPDLVLAPETEIVIGTDDYERTACVVLPTGTTEPRVASAFEIKPGLPTILRRATIYLGEACEGSRPLATWLPDQGEVPPEQTTGHAIPAGASLAVELHYVKGWEDEGKRLTDQSELGIEFSDTARVLSTMRMSDGSYTFDDSVELVALYPEPASGAPVSVEVVRAGGQAEPVLVIEDFRAEWREKYVLAEPLHLPAGSELRVSQPAVWIDFIESTSPAAE